MQFCYTDIYLKFTFYKQRMWLTCRVTFLIEKDIKRYRSYRKGFHIKRYRSSTRKAVTWKEKPII
jgi:hypothetical protein